MIRTLPLSADTDGSDAVGELSVCLDGMQLDPDTFASEEQKHSKKSCSLQSISLLHIHVNQNTKYNKQVFADMQQSARNCFLMN